MIYLELLKQYAVSPHEVIFGRIYIGDRPLPLNPGMVAYYPDSWIELWLKLGRCEIRGSEILEACLADS